MPNPITFSSTASAPKIVVPMKGIGGKIVSSLKLLFAVLLSGFLAIFGFGMISAVSTNMSVTGVGLQFDPIITLSYLVIAYMLSSYYQLNRAQGYKYFILALVLSYTTSFLQGSLFLVILIPVMKWLKLVTIEAGSRS